MKQDSLWRFLVHRDFISIVSACSLLPYCGNWEIIYKILFTNERHWNRLQFMLGRYPIHDISQKISSINVIVLDDTPRIIISHGELFSEWAIQGQYISSTSIKGKLNDFTCSRIHAAFATQEGLKIFNFKSRSVEYEYTGFYSAVNRVVINDKYFAVGLWKGAVSVYDTSTGNLLCNFSGHRYPVYAIDQMGKYLATGGSDKTVKLWNLDNQKEIDTLKGAKKTILETKFVPKYEVTSLCNTDSDVDSGKLLTLDKDGDVILWDINTKQTIRKFTNTNTPSCISSLSPSKIFTGCSDGSVKWWDERVQDIVHNFEDEKSSVLGLYVDPFRIVTGHHNGFVAQREFWCYR